MSSVARILCGDATHAALYSQLLNGRRVHLLLTDPPFLLLERRRLDGRLRGERTRPVSSRVRKLDDPLVVRFSSSAAYMRFTSSWLSCAVPHLCPRTGHAVIFSNALGRAPITQACAVAGLHLIGRVPWAKASKALAATSTANEEMLRVYEHALVFSRHMPPPPLPGDPPSLLHDLAIVTGYHEGDSHAHPHHKPASMLTPLIRAFSRPGDVVMDCFAGSGSTIIAADALGRQGVGIELNGEWARAAAEAVAQAANKDVKAALR